MQHHTLPVKESENKHLKQKEQPAKAESGRKQDRLETFGIWKIDSSAVRQASERRDRSLAWEQGMQSHDEFSMAVLKARGGWKTDATVGEEGSNYSKAS